MQQVRDGCVTGVAARRQWNSGSAARPTRIKEMLGTRTAHCPLKLLGTELGAVVGHQPLQLPAVLSYPMAEDRGVLGRGVLACGAQEGPGEGAADVGGRVLPVHLCG